MCKNYDCVSKKFLHFTYHLDPDFLDWVLKVRFISNILNKRLLWQRLMCAHIHFSHTAIRFVHSTLSRIYSVEIGTVELTRRFRPVSCLSPAQLVILILLQVKWFKSMIQVARNRICEWKKSSNTMSGPTKSPITWKKCMFSIFLNQACYYHKNLAA